MPKRDQERWSDVAMNAWPTTALCLYHPPMLDRHEVCGPVLSQCQNVRA